MSQTETIYQGGVFKPLTPVNLGNSGLDGVAADAAIYKAVRASFPRIKLLADWQ